MRLAKRFCRNPISVTTKLNSKKNAKRIAENYAVLKSLAEGNTKENTK